MIVPSIDIMGGKAVQLVQGKKKVLEREDVLGLAREFGRYGDVAVIDLDAAMGRGDNLELIKDVCRIAECRVGGGVRTVKRAEELLGAGAGKVIIGTKAEPSFLKRLPRERVIAALDTKGGSVMEKGWAESKKIGPEALMKKLDPYCSGFLFTDIQREGTMKGFDLRKIARLTDMTRNRITAAGGISSVEEIRKLEAMGVDSQLGMAVYTEAVRLDEAFVSVLDFDRNGGLVPTIVQDYDGQVLMLAFSSRESVLRSFGTGKATYYSRSRKKLWTKGEESGNFQELLKARYDCDRDTLLFTVRQKGPACHTSLYSCFGTREFSIRQLYNVIRDRAENPVKGSYTSSMIRDIGEIKRKISEECGEVLDYTGRDNLVWEVADLAYFILALMAKEGVKPEEVLNELWRRRR